MANVTMDRCTMERCNMNRCNNMKPCPGQADGLQYQALAMAYVPWQHIKSLYEPDQALLCGTVFPELNKPFLGRKGCMK